MNRIRMYNCGFGDCFRLESQNECLYVDFGILQRSNDGFLQAQYENIIKDMPKGCDFLLTHYHKDHYNGVLHMYKHKCKKKFQNIYIPDIWSVEECVPIIVLHLLKEILEKSTLSNNISIFDFIMGICSENGNVHFVKRNSNIQKKYIALWPDQNWIINKANNIMHTLNDNEENNYRIDRLYNVSSEFRKIVVSMTNEGISENNNIRLEELKNSLLQIAGGTKANPIIQQHLKNFGNEISIVFQNKENDNANILFTGDFGNGRNSFWNHIESEQDDLSLHDSYRVIKIPHHGLKSYYHSFDMKMNEKTYLLIPNGNNSHKWNIYEQYSSDANSHSCKVICNDNLNCSAVNEKKCACHSCCLLSSQKYKDIELDDK